MKFNLNHDPNNKTLAIPRAPFPAPLCSSPDLQASAT